MRSTIYSFNCSERPIDALYACLMDTVTGREYDFASGGFVRRGSATSPFLAMDRMDGPHANGFRAVVNPPDPAGDSDYLVTFHLTRGGPVVDSDYLTPDGAISLPLAPSDGPSATFVGSDTTTSGAWPSGYGSEGYQVVDGEVRLPAYATLTPRGFSPYTWEADTIDPRALVRSPDSSARVAACLYSGSNFTLDVDLTDRRSHRLSAYLLDWDRDGREVLVEVEDQSSGAVLDARTVTDFVEGIYLTWSVAGRVRLRFTSRSSNSNAVVSGLFLGTEPATTR